MRYKILSIFIVLSILTMAVVFEAVEIKSDRYHQHQEAQPKADCTDHGADVFCTHLPLLSITTDAEIPHPYRLDEGGEILKQENGLPVFNDETVSASVAYYDSESKNNHLSDTPVVDEKALTRMRGRSSRAFDKQGYSIKFKEENGIDNKNISLSGMTADSDWVLHGPFLDKTLIRNYLSYNLAGEMMEYAPNVRFCEMFLNGAYMGVYVLTEKIGYNNDGRITITQTDEDIQQTSYILAIDSGAKDPLDQLNTFGSITHRTTPQGLQSGQMEVVYPSGTLTAEQRDYIAADISQFEKAIYSFDYSDKKVGYHKYIDVASFVDYFIINEFTLNYDAMGLSTFVYKDIRGKLNLCVWDFNAGFDYYQYSSVSPQTFRLQDTFWYESLFRDDYFVQQVIKRYDELRETVLSEDYLLDYVDATISYLGDAVDRNYEKWGYTFAEEEDLLLPTQRNPRNYEDAITQLKIAIIERGDYMDNNMTQLYRYSHESTNKQFNYDSKGD